MTFEVSTLMNLYRFPSGRRQSCLLSMREALEGGDFADLRAQLSEAIVAEREIRQLEVRFRAIRSPRSEYSSAASEIDVELDRALGALDDGLGVWLKGLGADSPEGEAATLARERLFPQGVAAVVHMPFKEQEAEVRALLERIQDDPELARAVRVTGTERIVSRVAELNRRYGEAIRDKQEPVTYGEVRAARSAGQSRLCWLLIRAAARFADAAPGSDEAARLATAIEVVLAENAAIRRYRKRRRNVTDVEPEDESEPLTADDDPSAEPDAEAA